jgi:hypothetical protein
MFERRYKSLPSTNLPDAGYLPSTSSNEPCRLYREHLCRRPKSIFRSHFEALCLHRQYCLLYIHTGHNMDATVLSMGIPMRVSFKFYARHKNIDIQTRIYSVFIKYRKEGDIFDTDCIIVNLLVADFRVMSQKSSKLTINYHF